MKKTLLTLGLAAMTCLTLTSCHKTLMHNAFEVPEEFDENKEYTIEFWAKNDSDTQQIAVYQEAIDDFNSYYPNIHVNLRNFTSYPDIYREVLLNMATDSTPNVCISYPDNVATYLESDNSVIALSYLLEDRQYGLNGNKVKFLKDNGKIKINSTFLNEGKIGEEYYTIPFMRSTEALYINKTYVERLGFEIPEIPTWDWIWEVCEAAVEERYSGTTITSKTDPSKDFKPLIYKSSDNWMIQYTKQAGIDYTTSDGKMLLLNDDTAEFLLDLKQKCIDGYYEVFANSSHYPGDMINVWDSIFGIDSTAGASWIGYDSPQGTSSLGYEAFETEITVVPQVDAKNPKMISQGPSVCVFNKADADEVLASWLFAEFLLTDKVQMNYQKTEGYLPVTDNVLKSKDFEDYLNGDEIYSGCKKVKELLMKHYDDTFITPVFNGSANVRTASGFLIQGVSTQTNSFSTREGIDKLYDKAVKNYVLSDLLPVEDNEEVVVEKKKLSKEGVILISTVCSIWVLIGLYVGFDRYRNYQKKSNN